VQDVVQINEGKLGDNKGKAVNKVLK